MKKISPLCFFLPLARMMRPGITFRPVAWRRILVSGAWVLGLIICGLACPQAVKAQNESDIAIEAPLLDVSHGQRAFRQVERWLSDSSSARRGSKPINVTGLVGVRLVLRSGGVIVGEGRAYREDMLNVLDHPGDAVDLVPVLLLAVERAELGVLESLADSRLRAVVTGRSLTETKKISVADVSSNLNIELELGYGLRTITVPDKAPDDAVFSHFAPCYHGLAFVDSGRGEWAWIWPGDAIARNIAPSSQLVLGLKEIGYPRDAVRTLGRPDGAGLARFSTIHMVRPYTGSDPAVLIRSRTAQPRYAVSERELVSMGDRLIENLASRFTTDGEVRGTYHPTSGRYDPPLAVDDQAALACYAMVHHSRYLMQVKPEDKSTAVFMRRATRLASQIAENRIYDKDEVEPRVVSLLLLTHLEAPDSVADADLRDRLGARLLGYVKEQEGQKMGAGAASLSAAALGTWFERTRDEAVGEVVWGLMDRLWENPGRAPNLVALPWLALTQERVGELLAEVDETGKRKAELDRRKLILAKVIDRLCAYQVIDKPTLGPDDVQGGFVLSPGPEGSPPSPDWRNAQPLMFISTVLRDEVATAGQDKLGWLLSAGYSARFVEQLMMNDASSYYVRDRIAAKGAVRMAPWDNRLALAPTAMSLLAVTELQTSLATFKPGSPESPESSEEASEGDSAQSSHEESGASGGVDVKAGTGTP